MKHLCQEEVGVLIWVASRTRPDITGSVSIAATLTTFNPDEGFNLIKGIWKYMAATVDYYLEYGSINVPRVTVFTDASFAPGERQIKGWRRNYLEMMNRSLVHNETTLGNSEHTII